VARRLDDATRAHQRRGGHGDVPPRQAVLHRRYDDQGREDCGARLPRRPRADRPARPQRTCRLTRSSGHGVPPAGGARGRGSVEVADPVAVVLGYVEAGWAYDRNSDASPRSFGEPDLRLANRGGARISAAQIAAILERRLAIERALRTIAPDAALTGSTVPWRPLEQLFDAFAGLKGVGFSKMTKTLHKKRPALIPMLDSVVQSYLADDDLGAGAPFGERAVGFVRGYKRDLDRNRTALRTLRQELAQRGYELTE